MHKYLLSIFIVLACQLPAIPAQVLIIRHAEKPSEGNSLSLKGKERAAAYIPFFMETKELLAHGTPTAIYAAQASHDDPSQRSVETVQALADKLKITINTKYGRDDYKAMVDEIKSDPSYKGKMVLISWEHTVIPEIARAFGALQTPSRWQPEVFDRIWKLTFSSIGGKPQFQNTPQRLMYGDSAYKLTLRTESAIWTEAKAPAIELSKRGQY